MAKRAMPNSKYNEHNAIDISGSSLTSCAGTKSPKPKMKLKQIGVEILK